MGEMKSFDLPAAKPNNVKKNFQKWTQKWNRLSAIIFGAFSFALLFSIVLVSVLTEDRSTRNGNEPKVSELNLKLALHINHAKSDLSETFLEECKLTQPFTIICQSIGISEIDEKIKELMEQIDQHDQKDSFTLRMRNIIFEEERLEQNWLNDTRISIGTIIIENSDSLKDIEDEAFTGYPFQKTKNLTLKNVHVTNLHKNIFTGFALENLAILNSESCKIEAGIMEKLRSSLKTFTVDTGLEDDPVDLTGKTLMTALEEIHLMNNKFGASLNDKTFAHLPNIKYLNLRRNEIESLTSHFFKQVAETLEKVDLTENKLKTLPQGLFRPFRSARAREINLDGNEFICNCQLAELKRYLMEKPWFDDPVCNFPPSTSGQSIRTVELCDILHSTYQIGKELGPGKTVPENGDNLSAVSVEQTTLSVSHDTIECFTCFDASYEQFECSESEQLYRHDESLLVRRKSLNFTVRELKNGIIEVIVSNPSRLKFALFWLCHDSNTPCTSVNYTKNDGICSHCQVSSETRILIPNLQTNFLYIFCVIKLMKYGVNELSLFDCLPFKTKPSDDDEPWLQQDDKILIYTIAASSLLLCAFAGALVMYLIVRKMPTLLKGSERVIIVKDKEVIVMPNNRKKFSKTDSLQSASTATIQSRPLPNPEPSAYLTPVTHKSVIFKQIHRRFASDTSIESIRSYVSAVGPISATEKTVMCYSDYQGRCFTDLMDVPNTPPPLPQRRSIDKIDYAKVNKSPDMNIYAQYDYTKTTSAADKANE